MASPFRFLSIDEFERLGSAKKLVYLNEAMVELERANMPPEARGWHSLFRQQQQQQQPQPPPRQDTDRPEEK